MSAVSLSSKLARESVYVRTCLCVCVVHGVRARERRRARGGSVWWCCHICSPRFQSNMQLHCTLCKVMEIDPLHNKREGSRRGMLCTRCTLGMQPACMVCCRT